MVRKVPHKILFLELHGSNYFTSKSKYRETADENVKKRNPSATESEQYPFAVLYNTSFIASFHLGLKKQFILESTADERGRERERGTWRTELNPAACLYAFDFLLWDLPKNNQ